MINLAISDNVLIYLVVFVSVMKSSSTPSSINCLCVISTMTKQWSDTETEVVQNKGNNKINSDIMDYNF